MKKEDLRIVYMGTPEFAVEGLRCLVEGGYNIVGVITMPDNLPGVDIKFNILQSSSMHWIMISPCCSRKN